MSDQPAWNDEYSLARAAASSGDVCRAYTSDIKAVNGIATNLVLNFIVGGISN